MKVDYIRCLIQYRYTIFLTEYFTLLSVHKTVLVRSPRLVGLRNAQQYFTQPSQAMSLQSSKRVTAFLKTFPNNAPIVVKRWPLWASVPNESDPDPNNKLLKKKV